MKKLLIVGTGGVGSFLARNLYEYEQNNQLFGLQITLADGDEVDVKNLIYQNFSDEDILENKAKTLAQKYNFLHIARFIDVNKDLDKYDAVVCAVDGTKFRKQFYDYMFNKHPEKYWIDLRSTGKLVAAYCKHPKQTYEDMLKTVPKDDIENGSCQLKFELDTGIVQGGNRIIAEIGAQLLLTWYRNDEKSNPIKFTYNF